jgi:tyrosine-protein kinase Etk/Wzc
MKDDLTVPGMEEQEVKLLDLLQVIVKQKALILKLVGGAAIISVIYSLLLPNVYTATAKVLPPQKEGAGGLSALSAMIGSAGGLASLAGGSLGGSSELYLGILKSRSVEDAVIKRLNLVRIFETKTPEETRKVLESKVKLQAGKDGIITIAADDKDPKLAAAMANAFVEELGNKSVQLNLSKAGVERVFLEKRLELVKKDLKNAEESLKSFQEKNKAIKVDSQAIATIQGIAQMRAELISKEVQLATLRSYQTDENPQVKQLLTGIARLQGQLGAYEGSGMSGGAIPAVGNVPGLGMEFARRLREMKIQETIFEQLTKQYELAKLTEAKDSSSLQVLDDAVVPMKKSKPKRSMIVIIATIIAFSIGILLAFIREFTAKMPEQDRVQWQEIKSQVGFRLPWKKRL